MPVNNNFHLNQYVTLNKHGYWRKIPPVIFDKKKKPGNT